MNGICNYREVMTSDLIGEDFRYFLGQNRETISDSQSNLQTEIEIEHICSFLIVVGSHLFLSEICLTHETTHEILDCAKIKD